MGVEREEEMAHVWVVEQELSKKWEALRWIYRTKEKALTHVNQKELDERFGHTLQKRHKYRVRKYERVER